METSRFRQIAIEKNTIIYVLAFFIALDAIYIGRMVVFVNNVPPVEVRYVPSLFQSRIDSHNAQDAYIIEQSLSLVDEIRNVSIVNVPAFMVRFISYAAPSYREKLKDVLKLFGDDLVERNVNIVSTFDQDSIVVKDNLFSVVCSTVYKDASSMTPFATERIRLFLKWEKNRASKLEITKYYYEVLEDYRAL